jgi:hypothetical protein
MYFLIKLVLVSSNNQSLESKFHMIIITSLKDIQLVQISKDVFLIKKRTCT